MTPCTAGTLAGKRCRNPGTYAGLCGTHYPVQGNIKPPYPDWVTEYRARGICLDCGRDTLPDGGRGEFFQLQTDVWRKTGVGKHGGMLCVGCCEARLGRRLEPDDFEDLWSPPGQGINDGPFCFPGVRRTRRLVSRQRGHR